MGGAYSAGQTYAALTFVENDGSLYISLQTAYGIEPGVSANWEQYWMLCASRGEKGDTGDGLKILGHYDTLQALQQAVPNPAAGDAYSIGTSAAVSVIANLELSGSVITGRFKARKARQGKSRLELLRLALRGLMQALQTSEQRRVPYWIL